jgi:hypothetical protein
MKKELIDNSGFIADQNEKEVFKQNARITALEKAMGVNQGFGADRLIEDAEKIYQWLIEEL